jgi:hypothetical protein
MAQMNDTLYRLIYMSRNEIKGDEKKILGEVENILSNSRSKNQRASITGALMFNAGIFAQVLEGPHDSIQATYERIQGDLRHSNMVILSIEPVNERQFANWSMAYIGVDSIASAKFSEMTKASGYDPTKMNGDHVFGLLKDHLLEAEARAANQQPNRH